MKMSSKVWVPLLVLAVLGGATDGAMATAAINSSKSNSFRVDPKHTEQDCTALKGTVSTDPKYGKICTLPPGVPVPAGATTLASSKSNSSE